MKRMLILGVAVALSGCGMLKMPDKMDAMNEQVGKTNEGMAKTNSAIHNQTLAVAFAEMMKPENTAYLSPAPLGMMPAGQVFANEATADDMIKIIYVQLTDVDLSAPDDSAQDPTTHAFPPALIKQVDHEKQAKLMASMVIAGLAPQATIDQIKSEQIDHGGRYEQTAYAMLMLRYAFVRDILLGGSLFEHPMSNPGMLTEASDRADQLEAISSLPYAAKVGIKTTGMLSADDNVTLTLDANDTVAAWRKIDQAFDSELDSKYTVNKGELGGNLQALRARVRSHIPAVSAQPAPAPAPEPAPEPVTPPVQPAPQPVTPPPAT